MTYLFFNVYWFLRILKPAVLLPHANTQMNPDAIAYFPVDYTTRRMSLCTGLAVYNQAKRLTTGNSAFVLGQKNSAAHGRVGAFQILFWLPGEYTQDLRFVNRTRKFQNIRTRFLRMNVFESNFVFIFIREKRRRKTYAF